jgi:hypothetical protein
LEKKMEGMRSSEGLEGVGEKGLEKGNFTTSGAAEGGSGEEGIPGRRS